MLGVELQNYGRFQPYRAFDSSFPATRSVVDQEGLRQSFSQSNSLNRIQQILNQRVADSLGSPPRAQQFNPQNSAFDAEEVANNVMGVIQNRLGQAAEEGADEQQLQALREQARAGIEQGTREARDVLLGLGILNASVEDQIGRVSGLLNESLDVASGDPASGNAVSETQDVTMLAIEQQYRSQAESSFELEIMTRDGDQVVLKFHQASSESGFISYQQSPDAEVLSTGQSSALLQRFELSLVGELDAEELAAITDFTHNVAQLSDTLYDGNVQAAFEQGIQLGFDTQQIAGFALEMAYSRSSVATARYHEMSVLGQDAPPRLAGMEQMRGLLGQMRDVIGQADSLFAQPEQTTSSLLTGFVSHHPQAEAFAGMLGRRGGDDLEEILEKMVGQVSGEHGDRDD